MSSGVRWRWAMAAGAAVGVLPQLLLYPLIYGYILLISLLGLSGDPEQFGLAVGLWGLPVTQMILAFLAVFWTARRVGREPVRYGVWVALLSVVVGQLAGLFYGPLDPVALAKYLVLALAGGLLGSLESRGALLEQEALYRASRAIGLSREPQTIADAIGEHLGNPVALRWSGSPEEGNAAPTPRLPWFLGGWAEGARPEGALAEGINPRASSERLAPWMLRASTLPASERAAWREQSIRTALVVPLVAFDRGPIGLLAVASRGRRFSRGAIRRYQTVGAQAALALENMRLLEDARRVGRQAGVLRERQRMAHEIHDTLAQGFTSIVMNLEAAEGIASLGRTPRPGSGEAGLRRHLDQARATARESLTEARRLVWALRPEALENLPLPEALSQLAEKWSKESGIAAGAAVAGEPRRLPEEVEATLYRVAQEALANVRKHAVGAGWAMLTLSYMGAAVSLDVRDDGAGFDPDLENRKVRSGTSGGFGLKGMRERLEGAGGSLCVESAPGEGTALAVEFPLRELPLHGTGTAESVLEPDAEPARKAP